MPNRNTQEFDDIIKDIIENPKVQEMKKYRQHYETSTFDHCYMVAYYCYKVCKKLKLDYKSAVRAGMLHDFFLYDWHVKDKSHRLHGFRHPYFALENARKEYELDPVLEDMIVKHMFPLIPIPPKYKESWVLCIADKICASKETILRK